MSPDKHIDDDDEAGDLEKLRTKLMAGLIATHDRHKAETRIPRNVRGARKTSTKSVQLNVRVTPETKRRIAVLAKAKGESLAQFIEFAIEERAGK